MQSISLKQAHIMVQLERALNPPLKWAGGKRWLLPKMAEMYYEHRRRRLVEPFCGGAAITLGLRPDLALLNDFNYHLINFYRQIKLHGLVMSTEMRYDSDLYYQHRDTFNQLRSVGKSDTPLAAELFYYLNRTCFNGLCRFNAKGGFNVPFGQYTTVNYVADFMQHKKAFKHWTFENRDFEDVDIEPDDFIYCDPPYDVVFTTYSPGGFDWTHQERLHAWLLKHPGPVVVSNQATERIIKLYSNDFRIAIVEGPRRISRTGDRTPAQEMLATRNL
jgi:DNA adenine methylase